MSISKNVDEIKKIIQNSRNPQATIVAISKYASAQEIIEAYDAGIRNFGENYVVPAIQKMQELDEKPNKDIQWHLVGHLQKNKVKKAVGKFDLIQSLDSLELAELISEEAGKQGVEQKVLLQVNLTEEQSKTGFKASSLRKDFPRISNLANLKIEGFMSMGASESTNSKEDTEKFGTICESLSQLKRELAPESSILSLGMSRDFQIALDCGSTMIRLGKAIFGSERET